MSRGPSLGWEGPLSRPPTDADSMRLQLALGTGIDPRHHEQVEVEKSREHVEVTGGFAVQRLGVQRSIEREGLAQSRYCLVAVDVVVGDAKPEERGAHEQQTLVIAEGLSRFEPQIGADHRRLPGFVGRRARAADGARSRRGCARAGPWARAVATRGSGLAAWCESAGQWRPQFCRAANTMSGANTGVGAASARVRGGLGMSGEKVTTFMQPKLP